LPIEPIAPFRASERNGTSLDCLVNGLGERLGTNGRLVCRSQHVHRGSWCMEPSAL